MTPFNFAKNVVSFAAELVAFANPWSQVSWDVPLAFRKAGADDDCLSKLTISCRIFLKSKRYRYMAEKICCEGTSMN
jgi:hypothetical protein